MRKRTSRIGFNPMRYGRRHLQFTALFIVAVISLTAVSALAQVVPEPEPECALCGAKKGQHKPGCPYYKPPDTGGHGGGYYGVPENPRIDYGEEFERFRTDEAMASNNKGIEYYNKGEWSKAISCFKRAAKYRPDVEVYKTNIKNAVAQKEGRAARERMEKERKKAYEENMRRAQKAITALKQDTLRALENLGCSAYWSLQAASTALDAADGVSVDLDDDWARARKYAQLAADAMEGRARSGWPGISISIPELPPPVAANPQVRLYDYIAKESRELVSAVIETSEEIRDVSRQLEKTRTDLADTQAEKKQLEQRIEVTKSAQVKAELVAKKKEAEVKEDVLSGLAADLLEEANDLNKKVDEQKERGNELQGLYDDLRDDPGRAQELLDRQTGKSGVK